MHECFIAVPELVSKMRFTPESALQVGTQVHTAPEAFGKVMSAIKPRMAVAYHFFKDFDTTSGVYERIRSTYDGPLSLAEDYMVWNVTEDDIKVREVFVNENAWPPAAVYEVPAFDRSKALNPSDFLQSNAYDVTDVDQVTYDRINQRYGTNIPMRMKLYLERLSR